MPSAAARTHTGLKRVQNEDSYLVLQHRRFWAVADGLGGQAGGQEASVLAVAALEEYILALDSRREIQEELRAGIAYANDVVFEEAAVSVAKSRMGTTLTALAIDKRSYAIGHIGDSRAYLWRAGTLTQLTRDHTRAQRLVAGGAMTSEEAAGSATRHVLTAYVGQDLSCRPDIVSGTVRPGDRFLLCTDGLTNELSDQQIAGLLTISATDQVVEQLVEAALAVGGRDNLTAVLVEV